jgi:hypothetical protein
MSKFISDADTLCGKKAVELTDVFKRMLLEMYEEGKEQTTAGAVSMAYVNGYNAGLKAALDAAEQKDCEHDWYVSDLDACWCKLCGVKNKYYVRGKQ